MKAIARESLAVADADDPRLSHITDLAAVRQRADRDLIHAWRQASAAHPEVPVHVALAAAERAEGDATDRLQSRDPATEQPVVADYALHEDADARGLQEREGDRPDAHKSLARHPDVAIESRAGLRMLG